MFELLWQRLDQGARLTLPFATALLGALLGVMTWPIPYFGMVAPPLVLIAIYYWTIHRPDLLRPWMVFLVGILHDVINFLPLGLSAFLFVGGQHLILSQRRFFVGHSFFMMWSGFALTVISVMVIEWMAICIIRWQGLPFFPVLIQSVLAIIIFPLPCWLLIRLQRAVLSQG